MVKIHRLDLAKLSADPYLILFLAINGLHPLCARVDGQEYNRRV